MSETLRNGILSLSESPLWITARYEWCLESIYFAVTPETCLCGQYPIIEVCVLRNSLNGNTAAVGNTCVKRFMGLPSDKIFSGVKRIRIKDTAAVNRETLEYAYQQRWINDWEYNFYLDTRLKRALSESQAAKRLQINSKIVNRVDSAHVGRR